MPLRERMEALENQVPAILSHNNVQSPSNPSSSGKKLLATVKKVFGELATNTKFYDSTLAAIEKQLIGVAKAPLESTDALFKNIDGLMRQAGRCKSIIVKNVVDLEKAIPGLKKEFGIK